MVLTQNKLDVTCGNCGEIAEKIVTVHCEPEEIWCLNCAFTEGASFSTPEEGVGTDDIEEAMEFWNCSYKKAYDRIEAGETWFDDIFSDNDNEEDD